MKKGVVQNCVENLNNYETRVDHHFSKETMMLEGDNKDMNSYNIKDNVHNDLSYEKHHSKLRNGSHLTIYEMEHMP